VEQGRHEHLLELKGLYYAMWRQQVGERRVELPARPAPALA
jgi:ATP-binding cassette subfamily B protein